MLKYLIAILNDEEAASLVEYALLVSLISVVAILALTKLGSNANIALNTAANSF